jgi:RNA polymerase sigma factor (sigma-70 family)
MTFAELERRCIISGIVQAVVEAKRNELAMTVYGTIISIASRFREPLKRKGFGVNDAVQNSMIAVLNAVEADLFDPSVGASFNSYVCAIVKNCVLTMIHPHLWHRLWSCGLGDRDKPDAHVPPSPGELTEMNAAVADLPIKDRQVLRLRFTQGMKFSDIGKAMGHSGHNPRSWAWWKVHDLLDKLAETLCPAER